MMLINTKWQFVLLALFLLAPEIIQNSYAQVLISVNSTTPCFQNYTASYHIFENCNLYNDFLSFTTLGWEWITGGYFSMILVSVIVVSVWKKYNEGVYALFVGIAFLPIAAAFFPDVFLSWAILMAFLGVGIWIWHALVNKTS